MQRDLDHLLGQSVGRGAHEERVGLYGENDAAEVGLDHQHEDLTARRQVLQRLRGHPLKQ